MISLAEIRADDMIDEGFIGRSTAMRDVFDQIRMVAPTDSTVLVCGETGTGKELVARAVHRLSARRAQAFLKCNCAAIPAALLESELFGHEKGAFTGAVVQRIGRFELANRGAIFLDEIGEMPLELQPKLLRVLQEREFDRLGSSRTIRTDVRVIAATNVDLPRMVAGKRFRADLYYRLNVFPIDVPPLREHPEDIPVLVRHFVREAAHRMNRRSLWISPSAMDALVAH
jgi:formate hydrogenlyase transcriptional activator